MKLARWCYRFAFGSMVALWGASCAGGEAAEEPAPEGEGGGGGEDSGGSGGSGPSTGGKGGKAGGGTTFPVGGAAGSPAGGAPGGGSGGTFPGTGGSGPPVGEFGSKCTSGDDCTSKLCVEVGKSGSPNQVCVDKCEAGKGCPKDAHCATLDNIGPTCIPDRESQCSVCTKDSDCKNQGDRCIISAAQSYCAQDCAFDESCPAGFECKAPPGALQGVKSCLLLANTECPCAPNRDKVTRPCTKKVDDKSCSGTEACNGSTSKYDACTAPDPAPEVCDGKDNDCDGKIDNPTNATCQCVGDKCTLQCEPGFTRYPATLPESEGCPCAADAGEPDKGTTCDTATSLADIADVGGKTSLSVSGTLSSDTDVDWFKINIKDTVEANTNTYHARITFEANPGDEFVMSVIRGTDCKQEAAVPTITSYDVCTNFKGVNKGMQTCGDAIDNTPKCSSSVSSIYLIAVKRSSAAKAKTCSKYVLKIEGAAGPCDEKSFDACGDQFGPKKQ